MNQDWKQYWQGKFKSVIPIEWLIPSCAMPFTKNNLFLKPILAKRNNDLMIELAMNAADSNSGSFQVNEADLFNQRVRSLIEIPHDQGR